MTTVTKASLPRPCQGGGGGGGESGEGKKIALGSEKGEEKVLEVLFQFVSRRKSMAVEREKGSRLTRSGRDSMAAISEKGQERVFSQKSLARETRRRSVTGEARRFFVLMAKTEKKGKE